MSILAGIARRIHRARERARTFVRRRIQGAEHVGRRAYGRRVATGDLPAYRKTVEDTPEGRAAFANEIWARELFGDRPWITPILRRGQRWIEVPAWPEEARLDHLAPRLGAEKRREIALQAVSAMLDLLVEGCAHRDFHGKNLFWIDGGLRVVDFETLGRYPDGGRPAFPDCYDMTGLGLDSPHLTGRQCYGHPGGSALGNLLGIPAERATSALVEHLAAELREASRTFARHDRRHACRAGRIYGSFALSRIRVEPAQAQRDSARRLERFGIDRSVLEGRSLLDLGSNVGAMLFESQKHRPARSLGLELDANKVAVARRVAAFDGLNAVRFQQGDLERLDPSHLGGPFDVVYCLAMVAHLRRPGLLYPLLARLTRGRLFFEGNEGTDVEEVRTRLAEAGFRGIEHLGVCDDDCRPENNRRPLFRAVR